MANNSDQSPPTDVCLLLRAHAEARWLGHEVIPVLRELEQRDSVPNEQLGAALAYLEVLWIEACGRAAETDATRAELDPPDPNGDHVLRANARRYHAAVRRLRKTVGLRVAQLLAVPSDASARQPISERHANS